MTILIDGADALRLLENAVAAKGADYVYPRGDPYKNEKPCVYARNGEPSCGVGFALFEAGVDVESLKRLDRLEDQDDVFGSTAISSEDVRYALRNEFDVILTDEAQMVFSEFQTNQDEGENWGTSLDWARKICSA